MVKHEVNELKKLLTPKKCSITRICGCYVDGEKNKKAEFKQAFLSLPEEEMYKYFELLRKPLGGALEKNLLTLQFPLDSEGEGSPQDLLLRLRDTKLKDDSVLEEFYDKIIKNYEYVGNYLIILVHDVYDVPGITGDNIAMEDASDTVYEYILGCICPVSLSDPGLSYNAEENSFRNRIRDWVVELPEKGFLFPAFNDRCSDIHSTMYYSKDAEDLKEFFAEQLFGCIMPPTAKNQKEIFKTIIEDTCGDECDMEIVKSIHDKLSEIVSEHEDDPMPIVLDKTEVKRILKDSGVKPEKLDDFDKTYEQAAGDDKTTMFVSNVRNARSFDIKSPDVVVKVSADRTDLVSTKIVDGRKCLVIELNGDVEINGITIHAGNLSEEEESTEA